MGELSKKLVQAKAQLDSRILAREEEETNITSTLKAIQEVKPVLLTQEDDTGRRLGDQSDNNDVIFCPHPRLKETFSPSERP